MTHITSTRSSRASLTLFMTPRAFNQSWMESIKREDPIQDNPPKKSEAEKKKLFVPQARVEPIQLLTAVWEKFLHWAGRSWCTYARHSDETDPLQSDAINQLDDRGYFLELWSSRGQEWGESFVICDWFCLFGYLLKVVKGKILCGYGGDCCGLSLGEPVLVPMWGKKLQWMLASSYTGKRGFASLNSFFFHWQYNSHTLITCDCNRRPYSCLLHTTLTTALMDLPQ